MNFPIRGWLLLLIILIIAVMCLVMLEVPSLENFSSPSSTMEYSVCRNKGFSKEHCMTRFVPGAERVNSGFYGNVISGS